MLARVGEIRRKRNDRFLIIIIIVVVVVVVLHCTSPETTQRKSSPANQPKFATSLDTLFVSLAA